MELFKTQKLQSLQSYANQIIEAFNSVLYHIIRIL